MGMMLNLLEEMNREELVKSKEKANYIIENLNLY
jgi:hypothetical protein